jgi:hypothetical protein
MSLSFDVLVGTLEAQNAGLLEEVNVLSTNLDVEVAQLKQRMDLI